MQKVKVGVLVSGTGTNLQALIDGVKRGFLPCEISVVISNKKEAFALKRAEKEGIPGYFIDEKDFREKTDYEKKIVEILKEYRVELVVLAGYLKVLSPYFVREFHNKIINVHPSLIPSFCGKGFYGRRVHEEVIKYGVKVTGATVHFVDEGTDTGPIILQKAVPVLDEDTPESLAERVKKVEHEILPLAVKLFAEKRLVIENRRVKIMGGLGGDGEKESNNIGI